jgi:hypothetical protein
VSVWGGGGGGGGAQAICCCFYDGLFIARYLQHVVPSRLTAGAAVNMPNEDTMIQVLLYFFKIELVFAFSHIALQ